MYSVQKAKVDEVPEIKQVLKETWIDTYGSYYSQDTIDEITSSWHDPKLLKEQIENPEVYFAVAKDEQGKVVGTTTAREIETEGRIMLDRLYVLPTFQGKGIGKALLESVIEHFKGLKEMFVDVEELNKGAIDFYKKQGFEVYDDDSEEVIGGKKFKVIEMVKRF